MIYPAPNDTASHSNTLLKVWDTLPIENEKVGDYSLGTRESLGEALEAVVGILGMAACEGSEVIAPHAISYNSSIWFFCWRSFCLGSIESGDGTVELCRYEADRSG